MLLPLDYNGFYQIFFSFIRKTSQNFCKKAWKSLLLCSQMDSNLTLNFSVLHKPLVVPWLWGFFVHTAKRRDRTGMKFGLWHNKPHNNFCFSQVSIAPGRNSPSSCGSGQLFLKDYWIYWINSSPHPW